MSPTPLVTCHLVSKGGPYKSRQICSASFGKHDRKKAGHVGRSLFAKQATGTIKAEFP